MAVCDGRHWSTEKHGLIYGLHAQSVCNLTGPLVKRDEEERGNVLERVEDGGGGRQTGSKEEKSQGGKDEHPKARGKVPSRDAHLRIGGKDDVTEGVEEATDQGGGVTDVLV